MYIVFIALWADSIYKVEIAEEIIAEQEAFMLVHNRTQDELDEVYVMLDCLSKEKDVVDHNISFATNYMDEVAGVNIDWKVAFELNQIK